MISGDDFEYGSGSTLFNTFGNDVILTGLTIRNVNFNNHYFRLKSSNGNEFQAYINTMINSKGINAVNNITILSCNFSSIMFESGTGFMYLNGRSINIKNISLVNISTGPNYFSSDSIWKDVRDIFKVNSQL